MALQVLIGLGVLVAAIGVALVLRRRRSVSATPVGDTYPIPRQLTRADFPRPEAPWLVVLFSSRTCDSCGDMRDKVAVLASDDVAVHDAEFSRERALHERYAISGVPMVVVADADGVVRRGFVGPVSATDLWAAVAAARDPDSA